MEMMPIATSTSHVLNKDLMQTKDFQLEFVSFNPIMTDTDYVDEKIERLKFEGEDLKKQINKKIKLIKNIKI